MFRLFVYRFLVMRFLSSLCLLLVLSTALSVASADDSETPGELTPAAHPATADVQKAASAFAQGRQEEALKRFIAIHKKHPDVAPGELLFAQLAFQTKQVAAGRAALENAAVAQRDDPETWNMLGALALADGRLAETEILLERALATAENYTANDQRKKLQAISAHRGLATVYEKRGQWKLAEKHLLGWIELDRRDTKPWPRLAIAFFKSGNESAARETLKNLRSFAPEVNPVNIAMGKMYQSVGRRQDATDAMRLSLKKDKDNFDAQVEIARYAMDAGEGELMLSAIKNAVSLEGDRTRVGWLQGMAARFDGDNDSAVEIFSELHRQEPSDFDVTNGLILSLLASEDPNQHILALKHAEVLFRSHSDATTASGRVAASTYAWALLKNKDLRNAERVIASVVKSRVLSPEIGYFASEIFSAVDKKDLARRILKATLASPQSFVDRPAAERLMSRLSS